MKLCSAHKQQIRAVGSFRFQGFQHEKPLNELQFKSNADKVPKKNWCCWFYFYIGECALAPSHRVHMISLHIITVCYIIGGEDTSVAAAT